MPIYEYVCHDCSEKFEVLCKYEELKQPCPYCDGLHTERELSAPSVLEGKRPYDYI